MKNNKNKSGLNGLIKALQKIFFVLSVLTQLSYIALLIYMSTVVDEKQAVNISLLVFSVAYLIAYIVLSSVKNKNAKKAKTAAKKIYKYAKLFLRFLSLGITVYGIYFTAKNFSLIAALLAGITFNLLVNEIIVEIITLIVAREARKLKTDVVESLNDIKSAFKGMKKKEKG